MRLVFTLAFALLMAGGQNPVRHGGGLVIGWILPFTMEK